MLKCRIECESTDRVPLSIIVLLPVEDLLLFACRKPDPALGHVESKVRAPSSGGSKEQKAFGRSRPDIKREVGSAADHKI